MFLFLSFLLFWGLPRSIVFFLLFFKLMIILQELQLRGQPHSQFKTCNRVELFDSGGAQPGQCAEDRTLNLRNLW